MQIVVLRNVFTSQSEDFFKDKPSQNCLFYLFQSLFSNCLTSHFSKILWRHLTSTLNSLPPCSCVICWVSRVIRNKHCIPVELDSYDGPQCMRLWWALVLSYYEAWILQRNWLLIKILLGENREVKEKARIIYGVLTFKWSCLLYCASQMTDDFENKQFFGTVTSWAQFYI